MIYQDHLDFKPELTPKEMFALGIFGKGYFRPIYCTVNQKYFYDQHKEFNFTVDQNSLKYIEQHNKYKVKCGTSLEYWQEKKWIHKQDPYGWVQWYCRFHAGRRTDDDIRQIKRWKDALRFVKWSKMKPHSQKLKQIMLHWAYKPL